MKIFKFFIIIILLFNMNIILPASETDVHWTKVSQNQANENRRNFHIAVDSFGNSYIIGNEIISGSKEYITLKKYDKNGNELWEKRYSGTADNKACDITIDKKDYIYIISSELVESEGYDIWIKKLNQNGNEIWTRTYKGLYPGQGYGIAVDEKYNVYVTGYITVPGEYENIWIRKYDENGNELWTSTYNSGLPEMGHDIAVDKKGNVYVTGKMIVNGEDYNIWIGKYDTQGNFLWMKTHNGDLNSDDEGFGIAVDQAGFVYVTGYETIPHEYENIWIRRYDQNGHVIWTRTYNSPADSHDKALDIAVSKNDFIYVTGYVSDKKGDYDIWLRKYNEKGQEVWTKTYNEKIVDISYGITLDKSENFYLAGAIKNKDISHDWLRKYACDLNIWKMHLLPAKVGQEYKSSFLANGPESLQWSFVSGVFPPGLKLLPDGKLEGYPIAQGKFDFVIKVTEPFGTFDEEAFTIVVKEADNPMITDNDQQDKKEIVFNLDKSGLTAIKIYTLDGKFIRELNVNAVAGMNIIYWDKLDNMNNIISPGNYIVNVRNGDLKKDFQIVIEK